MIKTRTKADTTTKLYSTKYTIQLDKLTSCLVFKLGKIDNGKIESVSHLYVTHAEIAQLIKEQYTVVKDCNSYANLCIRNNQLTIEYSELDINHYTGQIKGNYHVIHLPYNKFLEYYNSDIVSCKTISREKVKRAIVKVYSTELFQIKESKVLWNKLKRQLQNLSTWQYDTIHVCADIWTKKSFYFVAYVGDKSCMNGGIILHTDTDGKQYYSIHT